MLQTHILFVILTRHYMCICPFKIQLEGPTTSNRYIIKSNKSQKCVCLFVSIFSLYNALASISLGIYLQGTFKIGNVPNLIDYVGSVTCSFAVTYLHVIFWLKQTSVASYVNFVSNHGANRLSRIRSELLVTYTLHNMYISYYY